MTTSVISHRRDPLAEDRAVRGVAVAQQKARSCVPRGRLNYLLRKPRCRGMPRNIEPQNLSAIVNQDDHDIEQSPAAHSSSSAAGSATTIRYKPLALGLALPALASLPRRDGVGQADNGNPVASSRLPALLALAVNVWTPVSRSRSSRSDPADEQR